MYVQMSDGIRRCVHVAVSCNLQAVGRAVCQGVLLRVGCCLGSWLQASCAAALWMLWCRRPII
jgi:hypothetical protein